MRVLVGGGSWYGTAWTISMLAVLAAAPVGAQETGGDDGGSGVAAAIELRPRLIAISVADLDASVDWYRRIFGFEVGETYEFPDEGMRLAFVERDGFELELIELAGAVPDDPPEPYNPSTRRGFNKLAFWSDGIAALYERALAHGADVQSPLSPSRRLGRFFILSDPDGNWIQVFGPRPTG